MRVAALIENLPGTNEVYEFKQALEFVYSMPAEIKWPYYYGCLPDIVSGDGAPLDIFVITTKNVPRGGKVAVEVFDVLRFIDRGMEDPKLLSVAEGESIPDELELKRIYDNITSFIARKKVHSGTEFKFEGLGGREQAANLIES